MNDFLRSIFHLTNKYKLQCCQHVLKRIKVSKVSLDVSETSGVMYNSLVCEVKNLGTVSIPNLSKLCIANLSRSHKRK